MLKVLFMISNVFLLITWKLRSNSGLTCREKLFKIMFLIIYFIETDD